MGQAAVNEQVVSFRLTADEASALGDAARLAGTSRSAYVRDVLRAHLNAAEAAELRTRPGARTFPTPLGGEVTWWSRWNLWPNTGADTVGPS